MLLPVLVAPWVLVAVVALGAAACVLTSLKFRFCSYHRSRWIVAGLLGAMLSATVAPSPWIAAFLLTLAVAIPVSVVALEHGWIITLADPMLGASSLVMVSGWVVALGLLSAAVAEAGLLRVLLASLFLLASVNNAVGLIQVIHGIPGLVYLDAGFGEPGTVMRIPTGFLMNTWKVAAINALLAPAAIGAALVGPPWLSAVAILFLLGAAWHLATVGGLTCQVAAGAGLLTVLLTTGHLLMVSIVAPLALVAYPLVRRDLQENSRWEAWAVAWRLIRRHRGIGMGLGGWAGLRVQTPKEGERIWMWAHNDWLETLLEAGPLPLLCALGYLAVGIARVASGVGPLEGGLFGSLVTLAILSLGYMPWRVWPVNLFGLSVVACWEALQRG